MKPKSSKRKDNQASPTAERRRDERQVSAGEVWLVVDELENQLIRGRLLDFSDQGFRVEHEAQSLCAGQTAFFIHGSAEGRARVVWTCITSRRVETGFVIISRLPRRPGV